MKTKGSNSNTEEEVAKRRDEALKRALGMPHKPHKPGVAKKARQKKPRSQESR